LRLLYVILVFLRPPEPPETPYTHTDSNNMLAAVSTLRQLARQVGGSVKCDSGSCEWRQALVSGASGAPVRSNEEAGADLSKLRWGHSKRIAF